MNNQFQRINSKNPAREYKVLTIVILVLSLLIGIIVRWNFVSHTNFPINDGGFFYQMILDLVDNNFALPMFAKYNHANIPYAYPPLAFYITGGLHFLTKVPLLDLLHILPIIISILTIPVFYLFTEIFLQDRLFYRGLATYLFATLPRSFEWLVMGGGITRSLGFLFALLALIYSARSFKKKDGWFSISLASLFTGLTILSHPVASLFLGFSLIILFFYLWPSRIENFIFIGIISLLIASPWWINILSTHGLNPFIGATNTGHIDWFETKYLLTLNFEYENRFFLPIVSFLAIMGLFSDSKREALFLGLLVGPGYLIIPRGGVDLFTGYMALLGTLGFERIICNLSEEKTLDSRQLEYELINSNRPKILLFFIVIYTFVAAYTYKYVDGKVDLHINQNNYEAMIWLQEQTSKQSKILVLPSYDPHRNWPNDYLGEWLPAISKRESLATVQGFEWIPELFSERINKYIGLRSCIPYGIECIEKWQTKYGIEADYIYIGEKDKQLMIVKELINNKEYESAYDSEEVIIFEHHAR